MKDWISNHKQHLTPQLNGCAFCGQPVAAETKGKLEERRAVVAFIRGLAEQDRGAMGVLLRSVATDIEANAHRESGEEAERMGSED